MKKIKNWKKFEDLKPIEAARLSNGKTIGYVFRNKKTHSNEWVFLY